MTVYKVGQKVRASEHHDCHAVYDRNGKIINKQIGMTVGHTYTKTGTIIKIGVDGSTIALKSLDTEQLELVEKDHNGGVYIDIEPDKKTKGGMAYHRFYISEGLIKTTIDIIKEPPPRLAKPEEADADQLARISKLVDEVDPYPEAVEPVAWVCRYPDGTQKFYSTEPVGTFATKPVYLHPPRPASR